MVQISTIARVPSSCYLGREPCKIANTALWISESQKFTVTGLEKEKMLNTIERRLGDASKNSIKFGRKEAVWNFKRHCLHNLGV